MKSSDIPVLAAAHSMRKAAVIAGNCRPLVICCCKPPSPWDLSDHDQEMGRSVCLKYLESRDLHLVPHCRSCGNKKIQRKSWVMTVMNHEHQTLHPKSANTSNLKMFVHKVTFHVLTEFHATYGARRVDAASPDSQLSHTILTYFECDFLKDFFCQSSLQLEAQQIWRTSPYLHMIYK